MSWPVGPRITLGLVGLGLLAVIGWLVLEPSTTVSTGREVPVANRPAAQASPGGTVSTAGESAVPTVTYHEDVAAILHRNCAVCHRPGGAGPFSLLTFEDARRRATLIAAVTRSRYMPPWQPAAGRGEFFGVRRLSDADIETLSRWAELGGPQGDPAEGVAPPTFSSQWQLGPPDLTVRLEEAFRLKAIGVDEFRNFVLPLPVTAPRYVKAIEFRPGNPRVVHHAVVQIDRSRASRRRDAAEPGPGFGGMDLSDSQNPGGQFIGWTPGKIPVSDERLAWRLDPGTDLVVQLHMVPSGKTELVQPEIGLYFSDQPPSLHPVSLVLRNDDIDIPAGASEHVIEDDVTLPVPVQAVGIYPHAHYLGNEVEVWADLPDGTRKWLIHIPEWDFNWQDDYRYAKPVRLPAGATIRMRYTYDNSADNVRNPNHPPVRVRFGNRSSDEMATLTIQVLPDSDEQRWQLAEASARRRLSRRPDSWFLQNLVGTALNHQDRHQEAAGFFRTAAELDPQNPNPRFNLGNTWLARQQPGNAVAEYRAVLAIDPSHAQVRNNLAIALRMQGDTAQAIARLREQLELSPEDVRVHYNLGVALLDLGQPDQAIQFLESAIRLDPGLGAAFEDLGDALRLTGRSELASERYAAALAIDPRSLPGRFGQALVAVQWGNREQGLHQLGELLQEESGYLGRLNNEAWRMSTSGRAGEADAALALAQLAQASVDDDIAELLDTLAAALAANGRYQEAVQAINRALELVASGRADPNYRAAFESRRQLYRERRSYVASRRS